ncbi:hypothetical protein JCM10450v2_004637 [Rhodotorula kratochvilovae]
MPRLVALAALLALVALPSLARPSSSGPARLDSLAPAPGALSGDKTVEERSLDKLHSAVQRQNRANEPLASSPIEVEGDEGGKDSAATGTKRKRCVYIGTFFHAIDCNAPANSTSIPYSPPAPLVSATTGAEEEGVPVVTTGLVTARRGKATGKAESG